MSSPPDILIRSFRVYELETLHQLMHDTIRTVAVGLYTPAQAAVWAPDPESAAWRLQALRLRTSLMQSVSLVAEAEDRIIGFGNITPAGYLDYLYVHREAVRQGVGSRLLDALEDVARHAGAAEMTAHASFLLRPLLERRGFAVRERREMVVAGVTLVNFDMAKSLCG
jgi:putative acetyltransferase